ncbi:hypothetical protein F5Y09DRAFT_297417 [Xylaria sp. FL1042]|nr:hypothetical protein F5Y09DRAFT_297417 [Xylaria sp. FL1042]
MASSRFQETSHFEHNSPPASIHGGRGDVDAPARNSDDASSVDHVQEKAAAAAVPLTKRQKVKRHCGRFKWWYLGVGLIILIILLPLIFTKIIPAITQDIVTSQKLPVISGTFSALSPTQLSVTLETQLDTPLAADIDPTTLEVYNKGTPDYSPFINITLPKIHADHKTPVIVTNQTVTVTNQTELIKFFDQIFDKPESELSVKGKTTVHLGALHMGAHISKTITAASLNYLSGFGITSLRLIFPALQNGTNIKGTLNLPNAGVIALGIGNLTLDMYSGDTKIGFVTLYDLLLPPGNNTRYFDGQIYLDEIVPNLGKILDGQQDALNQGNIDLRAVGNSTMVNGEHIPYIEQVLNKKSLIASVPVITLLSDVISSFSNGGDASLSDLLGDTIGNSTFIEGLLGHWNSTSTNTTGTKSHLKMGRSTPYESRTIKAPATKSLLKMGLKLALAKL